MNTVKVKVDPNGSAVFNNNVDYCVGTGRLGLALTEEYLKELEYVQKMIGFSYIRGHGLFSDDVSNHTPDTAAHLSAPLPEFQLARAGKVRFCPHIQQVWLFSLK